VHDTLGMMLCESCHAKEATVHLTQVVDGRVSKHHLCEGCAEKQGIDVHAQPMDLSGMMANLKKHLAHLQDAPATVRPPAGPAACPVCGLTRKDILKRGRLGCDHCYDVFAPDMLPVIVSLQHNDQHLGKVPRRASERMKSSVEAARLQRELDRAVASENYELAANLRDQIKALPAAETAP